MLIDGDYLLLAYSSIATPSLIENLDTTKWSGEKELYQC